MAFMERLSKMQGAVDMMAQRIRNADPRNILSRGYSLVTDGRGVVLKSVLGVSEGDTVKVRFPDGVLECRVVNKN